MKKIVLPKRQTIMTTARLWRRLLAFIIDLFFIQIFLLAPFAPFLEKIQSNLFASLQEGATLSVTTSMLFFFMGCIMLLYFALFEYYLGATIGMNVFRLHVAGERTLGRCLLRNLYCVPLFPLTLLWIIEPLYLGWKSERILEKLSKTSTVEIMTI